MKRNIFSLILLIPLFSLLVSGCGDGKKDRPRREQNFLYSEFLKIYPGKGYTEIDIVNPWDTAKILHRYVLVDRTEELPEELPAGTVVRTPVDRIVVYSSVHAAVLEKLDATDRIAGICDVAYLRSPKIRSLVSSGAVTDCGNSMSPSIEKIAACGAEILIASPFENSSYGAVEKLKLPIIEAADYTESHPLGRCEWIRFYGLLLGCEEKADSLFAATADRYNGLKEKVAEAIRQSGKRRPTLIVEKRYGNTWAVPGGNSYTGRMYSDAGADYLFADLDSKGNVQKSFESMLEKGIHADCWLFKYTLDRAMTYEDLKEEYSLYTHFDAYRNRSIYGCNTLKSSYYEDIVLSPDRILTDLVAIFHPELSEGRSPEYFLPLK